MYLRALSAFLWLLITAPALADGTWTNRWDAGDLMAVTPVHQMQLRLATMPNEGTWGHLLIPVKADQLDELNKHRKDKLFPYIEVAVEVDKYYRTALGHTLADKRVVKTDLDVRQWEGLKKGRQLVVRLPDGTEYKEPLTGSRAALAEVEKRYD